mmetsp:Transcript_7491/g.23950  ORF Transcript_7491/g.23950 Transcript_7491/m.23950 type:complete len:210 (+) Transcript_7491:701-1330(+)
MRAAAAAAAAAADAGPLLFLPRRLPDLDRPPVTSLASPSVGRPSGSARVSASEASRSRPESPDVPLVPRHHDDTDLDRVRDPLVVRFASFSLARGRLGGGSRRCRSPSLSLSPRSATPSGFAARSGSPTPSRSAYKGACHVRNFTEDDTGCGDSARASSLALSPCKTSPTWHARSALPSPLSRSDSCFAFRLKIKLPRLRLSDIQSKYT